MAAGGIPGRAVAVATAGAFLVFVGIRDIPVLDGLRELTRGRLPEARNKPTGETTRAILAGLDTSSSTGSSGGSGTAVTGGSLPALVNAVTRYSGDKYSQSKRWQPGYSDCSSFVGKGLKDIGITPPGVSVTGSYLTWRQLKQIPREQLAAGDLCVNGGHMVVAVSNSEAIGQQNGRTNVRRGTPEQLMPGPFTSFRYVGPKPTTAKQMET